MEICQAELFLLPVVDSGKLWRPRSRDVTDSECHLRKVTRRSKDGVEPACYAAANGCSQLHPSIDIY